MVVIPPARTPSASCSDRFCQMKSLHHATLPAVKGRLSLILAFLADSGSWSTALLGPERLRKMYAQYGAPTIADWCFGWSQRIKLSFLL